MTPVNSEALLQLHQTRCLKRQRKYNDNYNADAASTPDDPFICIQRLDTRLFDSVTDGKYNMALYYSKDMLKHEKYSYYGYQRAAQIHLIQDNWKLAYDAYRKGLWNMGTSHGAEMLKNSIHDTIHIFDQRASELAKTGKLGDALEIAQYMIKLLPLFPTGYLRAGSVYEMQGKSKKAMETYEEPLSSDQYDKSLLIQRINNLQQRIDRMQRYDFISQLPMEIVPKILQYLDTSTLLESMNVADGWMKRILQSPDAWRVLTVDNPGEHMDIATFEEIKPFVHKVIIRTGDSNPTFLQDLLTSIGDGKFKNIVNFELAPDTMKVQYLSHITRALDGVNLTDLNLETDKSDSYIPLHQVLEACTHLKRLRYHTDSFAPGINYARLPQEPTSITHLSIGGYSSEFDEKIQDPSFLSPLLRLFPDLVYFCTTEYAPGDLQAIMDQCINIRHIVVTDCPDETLPTVAGSDCTLKGLQHLDIDGVFDPADVADVIAKASKTLKTLNVSLYSETTFDYGLIDTDWNWRDIPSLDCPFLEKLNFYVDYYWPFVKWIGDCPALTYSNTNVDCVGYNDHDPVDSSYRLIPNYDSRFHGPKNYMTRNDPGYYKD
ncbi:hypothetical protein BJV82DRAFT_598058 [Fennellomyces sp. T-0311]|nr:hypothetical protein BJV82DRAFT_598058 [Fennellomyces sp. T-0311]